jgi:hypothetical protein
MGFLGIRLGLPMQSSGAAAAAVAYRPLGVTITPEFVLKYVGGFTASPNGLFSIWLRGNVGSGGANIAKPGAVQLMNKNLIGNLDAVTDDSEQDPGMNFTPDNSGAGSTCTIRLNLIDSLGVGTLGHTGGGVNTLGNYGPPSIINGAWEHYLWAYQTNLASGQKKQSLYKNGVRVLSATTDAGTGASFSVALNNNGWFINATNSILSPAWCDLAHVWFDTPASMASYLSGSAGNWSIPAGVVSKFYNAGPVDLGTDGSTPTGTQPLVFHEVRPDGVATDFSTNRGTGGTPTQIKTNTLSSKAFLSATSPSVTPDRPYLVDFMNGNTGWSAGTSSGTNTTIPSNGIPIAVGDLLVMAVMMSQDTADSAHAPVVTGWTLMPNTRKNDTTSTWYTNFVLYYKVATEAIAAGTEWSADKPTVTWSAGAAFHAASWSLWVYSSPTASITISDSKAQNNANGVGYIAPSITAASGASLLVTGCGFYDWSNQPGDVGPPSAQSLRYKRADGASVNFPYLSDEAINASGLTGTRTWQTVSATKRPNVTFSFLLI